MMKRTLRIALTPFMLIARLVLGLVAFISSIASAVIGLTVGLFAVLSVIEFAIGYWQNGIAFMDFWASLEHTIRYKKNLPINAEVETELKECADSSREWDGKMERLLHLMR